MKKLLVLVLFLCSGAWVFAQSNYGNQDQNASGTQSGNTAATSGQSGTRSYNSTKGDVRISGCLKEDTATGNYVVKDDTTGTSYSLFGPSDIHDYVNDHVVAMGLPTGTSYDKASTPSQTSTVGQKASENPFMVHSLKPSGKCQ